MIIGFVRFLASAPLEVRARAATMRDIRTAFTRRHAGRPRVRRNAR